MITNFSKTTQTIECNCLKYSGHEIVKLFTQNGRQVTEPNLGSINLAKDALKDINRRQKHLDTAYGYH